MNRDEPRPLTRPGTLKTCRRCGRLFLPPADEGADPSEELCGYCAADWP